MCNTDLEIIRGYVPGYDTILGHEFVGVVEDDEAPEGLRGKRVVGEINCPCGPCPADLIERMEVDDIEAFMRNHAPKRTVLGIIERDGVMAEYCMIPQGCLKIVPDDVSDQEAVFCEPLAAACRIMEQRILRNTSSECGGEFDANHKKKVAVVGDGKLGLLIAHVLVMHGHIVSQFGRHPRKMELVEGVEERITVVGSRNDEAGMGDEERARAGMFDVVVEASGSPEGILLAASLTAPMGTLVLKSTCSTEDNSLRRMPLWSAVANDIVVNEKKVVGSRCGPFAPALKLLQHPKTKALVNSMVDAVYPIEQGMEAFERAGTKGTLKVQIVP